MTTITGIYILSHGNSSHPYYNNYSNEEYFEVDYLCVNSAH